MRRLLPVSTKPTLKRPHSALGRAVLALAAAIASQGSAHAEEQALGRLFFTPERRVALDRQRHLKVEESHVMDGATLSLDGVVRRSSGKSTVWINGVPYDSHTPSTEVRSRIDRHDPSRVTVSAGDEPPASLKVGESINRATGEKQDGLDDGYVSTRPAAAGISPSRR